MFADTMGFEYLQKGRRQPVQGLQMVKAVLMNLECLGAPLLAAHQIYKILL